MTEPQEPPAADDSRNGITLPAAPATVGDDDAAAWFAAADAATPAAPGPAVSAGPPTSANRTWIGVAVGVVALAAVAGGGLAFVNSRPSTDTQTATGALQIDIAAVGMGCNVFVILGVMAMPGLQATLTMPGIAGIVLTLAMSTDANILIFERMKEELAQGKSLVAALEAGYEKA